MVFGDSLVYQETLEIFLSSAFWFGKMLGELLPDCKDASPSPVYSLASCSTRGQWRKVMAQRQQITRCGLWATTEYFAGHHSKHLESLEASGLLSAEQIKSKSHCFGWIPVSEIIPGILEMVFVIFLNSSNAVLEYFSYSSFTHFLDFFHLKKSWGLPRAQRWAE